MRRVKRLPAGARRRLFIVFGLILAASIAARHLMERSGGAFGGDSPEAGARTSASIELPRGARSELLAAARAQLEADGTIASEVSARAGDHVAVVSLDRTSLGEAARTALTARASGATPADAVHAAVVELRRRADAGSRSGGRIKIDLVTEIGARETFDGDGRLSVDPSREGLLLEEVDILLLPEELVSRRLINADGDLQNGRLRRYVAEGGRQVSELEGNPGRSGSAVRRVTFDSFAEGEAGQPIRLYRGNQRSPELAPAALLAAARAGGDYLLRHQASNGDFDYIYLPRRDEIGDGYNLLRHAGTCYALLELYGATADERYLEAARAGIEALLQRSRGPRPDDTDADFEAIVSPGEEAKLGGAALAILAINLHERSTGDARWRPRAVALARFIMDQQGTNGRFESKYFYGAPDPEPFESIYYPGEAILALARLHRLDGDATWLEVARRGADYLIDVRDQGLETEKLPHDHWLLMGLEELHALTEDPRYLAHAERIAEAILGAQRTVSERLDWIGTFYDPPRATPTATRAEALVAMHRLAEANGLDATPYLMALMKMAAFQRRCQLRPENALYLSRPDLAIGGFRRSLENWEIRIDYVQHNVSALLGLRDLLTRASFRSADSS